MVGLHVLAGESVAVDADLRALFDEQHLGVGVQEVTQFLVVDLELNDGELDVPVVLLALLEAEDLQK